MKRAHQQRAAFVFVHSHPNGLAEFSPQDDLEEQKLFRTAYNRIDHPGPHASLVLTNAEHPLGRVWLGGGGTAPIDTIRVIGNRFRFYRLNQTHSQVGGSAGAKVEDLTFFDRQIRAFGPDLQPILSSLIVGVVGAGGTGSCVIEQLVRLGVGSVIVSDGDCFDPSNVNRVYGSRVIDAGVPKVKLAERLSADVGFGTKVRVLPRPITFKSVFDELRACDIVFGCTDDEWGRSLLTRLAIWYYIPVFDMGVKIDSDQGAIRSINGRVTTLLPGKACLFCRSRISAARVRAESLWAVAPDEAEQLRREGYIPELEDPAPAVISFTTTVAASGITELLHRLTGFLGSERTSSEVLHLLDSTRVRTNDRPGTADCFCGDPTRWGRGDSSPRLGLTWRPE
jgi:molybdopterin/thiamine biosynthesis adenylyltransferase